PHFSVAPGNFASWRERHPPFAQLAAARDENKVLLGSGEPDRVRVRRVTDGYFAIYGVAPRLGRGFLPEEDAEGHENVALLADGFWQRRFGGDPSVIGRALSLDGKSYTVVGVMPPHLHAVAMGENPANPVSIWIPAALTAEERATHGGHSFQVVGRL